jgi:uncharacterized protein
MTDLAKWHDLFAAKAAQLYPPTDPTHDVLHIQRVVNMALHLAEREGGDHAVILPAAYFHDFVNLPKNHPQRKEASKLSGEAAVTYLREVGYPMTDDGAAIAHAIEAHSFSAGIAARTLEAKIVQDADRLDALGAIGIARCMGVSTRVARPYYEATDPLAQHRALDDTRYGIDHFYVKLFKLPDLLNTQTAKTIAAERVAFMHSYLQQLAREANPAALG